MEENNTSSQIGDDFESLLDDFLSNELAGIEEYQPSEQALNANQPIQTDVDPSEDEEDIALLGIGERELIKAYYNFIEAVYTIANLNDVRAPKFVVTAKMMLPNYKPKTGKLLCQDVLLGWDLLLDTNADVLENLDMDSTDDEFLNFAEKLTDPNLQFAIVSYVEILIELESCELSYEEKKLRARKRKLELEFVEEQRKRNERKERFIKAVEEKHFPINAEKLVTNYLKTSLKDPKGAFIALTENPAIYSPIDFSKIKPRLFGLIKKGPKDGIRMNQKIGKFMKKLKA